MTPETLAASLSRLVDQAAAQGLTDLSLTLIAPITPRTVAELTDPCADPRYGQLARELNRADGPKVTLTVFPITRLRPEDTPDLTTIEPLALDPDAPTRPGGLTRCLAPPSGTSIYPFFVEPWRPDSDIAGRYTAALADRLARHLSTQLTQDQPRP